jgi:uroporphyrinogen decarboxylase
MIQVVWFRHTVGDTPQNKVNNFVEDLIKVGAEFICVLDPMASLLNLENVHDFSLSYLRNIEEICDKQNAISCLHICGNITPLIPKISLTHFDVLSIDSEDAGVNIDEISEIIHGDFILMGNLNPKGNLFFGTPADVENEVKGLLKLLEKKEQFILGTGCDLPSETPLENIISFVKYGLKFSK